MLFAISPGSEGTGQDRFSAYVPFVLQPGRNLVPLDSPITKEFGPDKLLLEPLHHSYAVSLGPFQTVSAAERNLCKLQAALLWVSLKYRVGLRYSKVIEAVDVPPQLEMEWIAVLLVERTNGETPQALHLNYALPVHLVRAEPPGTIWGSPKTWGKKVGWQRFQLRQSTPRRSPKWLPNENSIAPEGPSNKAPARGPRGPIKSGLPRPITSVARI